MALVGALESAYSEGDIKAHRMFDDLNYYLEVVPESHQISGDKTQVFLICSWFIQARCGHGIQNPGCTVHRQDRNVSDFAGAGKLPGLDSRIHQL
jgi:hypothetical protein